MKPFTVLGRLMLAALTVMAIVGVSSAAAENTALCSVDETECAVKNVIAHVHEETATGAKAKLLTNVATVECKALFLGDAEVVGTPLAITGNFTYTECKRGTENCTATEVSSSSTVEVLRLSHETADVTGEGEVNVHCGFIINCTYNGEGLLATATGPLLASFENGEVTLNEQTTHHVSGAFCPATGKLDIVSRPLVKTYISTSTLKMVCVFVGTNNGFYLGSGESGACASKDAKREGEYELGWATTIEKGAHVCALVGATSAGFYLSAEGTKCTGKDGTRAGSYELGIVQ